MDLEFWASLLKGFIFYGILYSIPIFIMEALIQYYIRKLCKYRGTKLKPGPVCVTCAYHHKCSRAKQSEEYKSYAYFRRVCPDKAKEIFDEIWNAEKTALKRACRASGEREKSIHNRK